MKIGIDCRMFGSGFGLARYTEQLVKHLLEIDLENQYILFFRNENVKELVAGSNKNVKIVIADIPWYSWAEQIKFKKIIRQQKVDLMHFPHWNVPLFYNDPFVVTVHDLIMYHYPRPEATTLGPIKFWIKDRLHRIVLGHAIKKAKHIIVTSEFTKQDIHDTLKVSNDKMITTYQAPFSYNISSLKDNEFVLQKYGIKKPYVMYVGTAYPHKNIEGLLNAWLKFQELHGDEYQLVLVGKENYFYQRLLVQQATHEIKNFVYTGFVEDDELSAIYLQSSLYVFPSFYEGFGLPPLEAQDHGVPVVSSNASCLPEVLGDSVLYFDPNSPDQMADMIHKALDDEGVRSELKQNAKENLKRFSWEGLAEKTLDLYRKFA
ncbi:MAG: glycosyltransferase family 4 protein [Candidatus Magasanikbacteria bacterium]|mgnify:FL=1|nr:glycosyltransferase family 4 protein [Candidatus Magasanikbacteria bacterium]MBT6819613.1 glycosyltransferase family 4 protein [Candidatus Magasanikbacteria bacterium]